MILIGRLTRDPEIRTAQNKESMTVARYTLAVDRRYKKEGDQSADFISCIAFNRNAEFAEKWFKKGIKVVVVGRIQTGSYTAKDGHKVYTTDVVIDEQEFAESKSANSNYQSQGNDRPPQQQNRQAPPSGEEFMNIPDGIDEELPFN